MPRYFFHVDDGTSFTDAMGTELPDIYAAHEEAIRTSGELLREVAGRFWDREEWRLKVADDAGHVLFVLRFSAEGSI